MSAAERQRRFRNRQNLGLAVVPVEVNLLALVEMLLTEDLIAPEDSENYSAICAATSRFIADHINYRDALLSGRGTVR